MTPSGPDGAAPGSLFAQVRRVWRGHTHGHASPCLPAAQQTPAAGTGLWPPPGCAPPRGDPRGRVPWTRAQLSGARSLRPRCPAATRTEPQPRLTRTPTPTRPAAGRTATGLPRPQPRPLPPDTPAFREWHTRRAAQQVTFGGTCPGQHSSLETRRAAAGHGVPPRRWTCLTVWTH